MLTYSFYTILRIATQLFLVDVTNSSILQFFIRPFEKRSYYVIPLGVRPSVRLSVRLSVRPSVNFFVSMQLLLQFTSD